MNQAILEDLKLVCEPETIAQSHIVIFLQLFFNTKKYYDHQWEEEKAIYNRLKLIIGKLVSSYSQQELNEALATFNQNQIEFQILQSAINSQSDRQ
jgi:hypothetical protein